MKNIIYITVITVLTIALFFSVTDMLGYRDIIMFNSAYAQGAATCTTY